jgi:delta 1-pyrroline-5-carboxylate dehydrogenase
VRSGLIKFPLVIAGVAPSSDLLREDFFLPVVALVTVADDQEAVRLANDCPFALAASIFSRNKNAAQEIAGAIKTGTVTINDLIVPTADPRLPFGGAGRSGFGVTRGPEGLLALTRPKAITRTRGDFRPAFESPQFCDEDLFQRYLELAHGRRWSERLGALTQLIRLLACRKRSRSHSKI